MFHALIFKLIKQYRASPDNINRELDGVVEALTFFNADEGFVVTIGQTDQLEKKGKVVHVVPAHHYLSNNNQRLTAKWISFPSANFASSGRLFIDFSIFRFIFVSLFHVC